MEIKIAELPEIGARIEKAMNDRGETPYTLAEKLKISNPTIYRWIDGSREGGCRQITLAAALLGLEPNDLLLADASRKDEPDIDEKELFALAQIGKHCAQIWRMTGGKRKPAAAIEAMLREVIVPFEEIDDINKMRKGKRSKK